MGILSNTQYTELDNGVRLCYFHKRGVAVELQIHIATGSIHEGKFLGCGLSHFLEHMAFQGCKGFPERSVAETVNQFGGDVNAYTGYDRTCYRMQLPREYWQKGMEMLSSMVRFPELPEARFVSERDVILRECERGRDNSGRMVQEQFMRTMFPQHPLRHPIIGYKEMIAEVTRSMAQEYHEQRYTPERCVVVAVGDLDCREFFETAGNFLGDWRRSHLAEIVLPQDPLPSGMRQSELIFPDPHERILMGCRLPGFGAGELPALELLFGVLGTGETSVLNRALVMDRPLALAVSSYCYSLGQISIGGIISRCEPGKVGKFRSALMRELERAAKGGISAAHVEREKGQQFADHLREFREPGNIAGEIAGGVLYDNSPDAGDTYLDNLLRVGIDEVKQAAEKYLDTSRWVIVHQHQQKKHPVSKVSRNSMAVTENEIDGNMKLIHIPDHQLPLCSLSMAIPGGALHESIEEAGISRLLAATLTAGCGKYSENTFLRKLDEAGVEFDVSAGSNSMTMEFSVPKRKMTKAVNLICTMLAEPQFENFAVEREKIRRLELLKSRSADPVKAAYDCAVKLLYGSHPYSWAKAGIAETVPGLDREKLQQYYFRCRAARPAVCGFSGDCTAAEAQRWGKMISDALGGSGASLKRPVQPEFPEAVRKQQFALEREQTVVVRMIPGVDSAENNNMDILEILSHAENGLASNIFKKVREDRALSYSVGMSFSAGFHPGTISFYAMTAEGAGEQVMALFNEEILRLGECGLDEEEFDAAKKGLLFDFGKTFDVPEVLLRTAVMDAYYQKPLTELYTRKERIEALSREEFNAALKKYFTAPVGVEVVTVPQKK